MTTPRLRLDLARATLAIVALLALVAPAGAQIQTEFYVPLPENEVLETLDDVNSATDDPVQTFLSITIPNDCRVYYDHWEDGYESNLASPSQASTLVWGNGADGDGVPPGFASDPNPLTGGTIIVLSNAITTGMTTGDEDPNAPGADANLQATVDFDGRDRIGTTCASAMTRAAWADVGTLNAGAVEVWPVADWGLVYTLPIGEDTANDANDFEIANVSILAAQNGTQVQIDHDADGTTDITVTLNRGQTYYLDSSSLAVNEGGTISASGPIQLDILTGDENSSYGGRWYAVLPVSSWDGCYYSPTNHQPRLSGGTAAVRVFLFNPHPTALGIASLDGNGGTSNVNVPAGAGAFFDMPTSPVGAQLCSTDGRVFYAGASVDHGGTTNDWGYHLIPAALLTNQLLVPWADGCDPTISPACTQNGSPVWVTPVCDTWIYADFDQDQVTDKIDLNGDGDTNDVVEGYDESTSDDGLFVSALDRVLLHDPSGDVSQTGALLYSLDAAGGSGGMGCDLAGVWGQNAANANAGTPSLDLGTLLIPFGADVRIEKATNGEDADTFADAVILTAGSSVTWTYVVTNTGDFDLENVEVTDDKLPSTSIGCDADNVIDLLEPGQSATCTATGAAVLGSYQNVATATGTPIGVTGLPVLFDVSDQDPSHYLGVQYGLSIDKQPATLLNDADGSGDVTEGDTLAWTILVSNSGTYALTGVKVSDDTATSLGCQRTGGAPFDHVGGAGLTVGETVVCTATYVVTAADATAGQVVNVATARSNETPPKMDGVVTPVVPPDTGGIRVDKTASPTLVSAVGENVTFTFVVTNLSTSGSLQLTGLVDDVFGDLNGQGTCSVPQTIGLGGSYTCAVTKLVSGAIGSTHVNTVTASGTDVTTGTPVTDQDPAEVHFFQVVGQACKHACPSKLFFRNGPDFFATEAKLEMPASLDPSSEPFSITIWNANGLVYSGELPAGYLARKGRKYLFKDKTAKTGPGLQDGFFKVQAKYSKDGLWRFKIRLYGDLSAATLPEMRIVITVGQQGFEREDVWSSNPKGWQLKRFK